MANKTLTASVKFNTKSAEASLNRLSKKINSVQKAITKTGENTKLTKAINKAVDQTNKLTAATNKWATATSKVATTTSKVANTAKKVNTANQQAASSARKLGNAYRSSNAHASNLATTVKRLAATYLGVMGTKAIITQSDTLTSAENRLNNLKGGNESLTQTSMDKIYSAAQRSRSGYGDMMGNVSKTMTLADDAFQGNIDNAIRFQEIMSKAYTVGGASAAEQASSMYQLVQALGSGILQGDELRSVREGAPIAYKKIEEFCQGVLNTEESLKDLASQGVVTSDMVVAAIMSAEEEINKSFKNTKTTFAQAWTQIKNTALKAFEPLLQKLNDLLNSDFGRAAIDNICKGIIILAETVDFLFDLFKKFFDWCADNWEWLKYIILGALIVIGTMFAITAAQAVISAIQTAWAWIQAYWPLLLIVAGIMAILYVYELWVQGTITTTEAIAYCLIVLGVVFLIVAAIMTAGIYLIVAAIILAIAAAILFFAEVCGGTYVAVQAVVNAWFWCGNVVMGIWEWIKAVAYNAMAGIVNFATGLGNSIGAICKNIGIAFENGWIHAQNTFWSFIQSVLEGIKWLEPAINAVAKAFGKEGFTLSGVIENVGAKQQQTKAYTSVSTAWESGVNTMEYRDLSDAWNKGYNTWDAFEDGWAKDAYNEGYNWGANIENKINEWGSQFQYQNKDDQGVFTDLNNLLGVDLGDMFNKIPDPNDPLNGVGGGYSPTGADDDIKNALDKLGGIEDDTGKMSDAMDLTQEDLEYLRRVADMEWKKEFTTASITVDMSNYNTINGENDLDGIVEKLADKLYDEMNAVANGVYE